VTVKTERCGENMKHIYVPCWRSEVWD